MYLLEIEVRTIKRDSRGVNKEKPKNIYIVINVWSKIAFKHMKFIFHILRVSNITKTGKRGRVRAWAMFICAIIA